MRTLLTIVAAAALAGPALACINDTELVDHEREFKAQYEESQYQPPEAESVSSARPYALGGAGALMAVAGTALIFRFRTQSR